MCTCCRIHGAALLTRPMSIRSVTVCATATHWYHCGLSNIDDAKTALLLPIADFLALLRRDQLRDRLACLHLRARERRKVHTESMARANILVKAHGMCWRGVETVVEFGRDELGEGKLSMRRSREDVVHGDPARI